MRYLAALWWTFLFVFLFPEPALAQDFLFGADLSFSDEMNDCGAAFKDNGVASDVFSIFRDHGTNLVRLRLWNDPNWTKYGTQTDIKRSIARAKAHGMKVLLDFHYSDDWADPQHQIVPAIWAGIKDDNALAKAVYAYTYNVLTELNRAGLMPEYVQIGNEINTELMVDEPWKAGVAVNWARDAKLVNAGIKAVRDASSATAIKTKVVLHIAQPENVESWLSSATAAGIVDFDVIGFSYYPQWSKYALAGVSATVNRLRHRYPNADVMVLETAYPWTLKWNDENRNVLNAQGLLPQYHASPDGQRQYMADLTQAVMAGGGAGVIYWAPDWVSTACRTRWGAGSTWENATFFDFDGEALSAIDFPKASYVKPVTVTFRFRGVAPAAGTHFILWGDFLGAKDIAVRLPDAAGQMQYVTTMAPGQKYRMQVFSDASLHVRLLDGVKVENGFYADTAPGTDTAMDLPLAVPAP